MTRTFVETGAWQDAVVAITETTSGEVNLGRVCESLSMYVPTLDSATVAVHASTAAGGTFATVSVTKEDGTRAAVLAGASTGGYFWTVPLGAQYIKVVCGAAQTSAARTFKVRGI